MTADDNLDMTDTLRLLDELRELLVELDGSRPNIEPNSKPVNAAKAVINRKLLYGEHLADLVRVDIKSHYHEFKGENPPHIAV